MSYQPHSVNLTDNQIKSITRAKTKIAPVSIRLKNSDLTNGNATLQLNNTQINQINKAIRDGKGVVLTLSATQIRYQDGEGLKEAGQKIKNFFENDVKNFFVDDVPQGLKALSKNGIPGVVGYAGARIAEAQKNRKARLTGGAIDPMMAMNAVGAIAPAIGDIAQTVGKYSNEQAKRGFAKNQITGKYARKYARNLRAMHRRAAKHYRRLQKLRDKGKMANLSDQQIWDMTRKTFLPQATDVQQLEGPIEEDEYDDDEYEDDVPENDDEAVEMYGGMLGYGLFIQGRGSFKTKQYKKNF
jgi:hypothetical protein